MTRRSQWSFKPEDLLHTPSSEDGFSLLRELELRAETCHIAFRVGLSIRPPGPASEDIHLILGGAATLLHRFFMRRSYSEFSPWRIAPVCLFIAAKDAERGMHVKQVARATLHRAAKNGLAPEVPHDDPAVLEREADILALEELVLQTVCWDLAPNLPYHPFTLGLRSVLPGLTRASEKLLLACLQTGWSFINDSLATPLVLLQPASVIAAAAHVLTMAAMHVRTLSDMMQSFPVWKRDFGVVDDDISIQDVEEAVLWIVGSQHIHRTRPEIEYCRNRMPSPLPASAFPVG